MNNIVHTKVFYTVNPKIQQQQNKTQLFMTDALLKF